MTENAHITSLLPRDGGFGRLEFSPISGVPEEISSKTMDE